MSSNSSAAANRASAKATRPFGLARAFVLVAWAFCRKAGVKLVIGGTRAFATATCIHIPAIDPNNPRALKMLWGYLAHEAGHIRFTDYDALERMVSEGNALLKALWNPLEDVWMENGMIAVLPGTRSTMDVTAEVVLVEEGRDVSASDPPAAIIHDAILVIGRCRYREQRFLEQRAAGAERVLREVFPQSFVLRFMALMTDISALRSTQDAIDLARRFLALIEEEAKPQQPEPEPEPDQSPDGETPDDCEQPGEGEAGSGKPDGGEDAPQDDAAGDESGADSAGDDPKEGDADASDEDADDQTSAEGGGPTGEADDADDDDGDASDNTAGNGGDETEADAAADDGTGTEEGTGGPQDAPAEEAEGEDDGAGEATGDPGSAEEDAGAEGAGDDGASGEEDADSGDGDDAGAGDSNGGGDGAGGREALQAVLDADRGDVPEDLFEQVARELEGMGSTNDAGVPIDLLPEAMDFYGDPYEGGQMVGDVAAESRRLITQLQGVVQSETQTRHRTVRRGRRLSTAHLYRAGVGDSRIFERSEERKAPNTAIHLLVDMSDSMSWTGIDRVAMEAALALALALESMPGVSVAATAFPHITENVVPLNQVTVILRRGETVRRKAGSFVQGGRGGTPLTGALWFAAAELLAAQEPRKVAIVLTDGVPNDRPSALDIVGRMTAAGVEVIGIGIDQDVSWLFPTHLSIRRIEELRPELMRIARKLLIA
jgi:cobaltochelatase CobT